MAASFLPFMHFSGEASYLLKEGGEPGSELEELRSEMFDSLGLGQPLGLLHRQPRPLLCSRACMSEHCQYFFSSFSHFPS